MPLGKRMQKVRLLRAIHTAKSFEKCAHLHAIVSFARVAYKRGVHMLPALA